MPEHNLEELRRRLAQIERMLSQALDPLTTERLKVLAFEVKKQITVAEARDPDVPSE